MREEEKEHNGLENSETKTVLWLETCLKLQALWTVLPFPFTLFKHVMWLIETSATLKRRLPSGGLAREDLGSKPGFAIY